MTNKEKLALVERNLRKRRLSATQTASLLRQHERLTKKIAGEETRIGRPPDEPTWEELLAKLLGERSVHELTADDEQVLAERLGGREEVVDVLVSRIESERRAQAQPKQDTSPVPRMTPADCESYLRSQHQGGPVEVAPADSTMEIKADVD